MATNFFKALEIVMVHEGGFVDDARDPGGATQFGISLRFLRAQGDDVGDIDGDGDVDADDIRALTPITAGAFYKTQFWDRFAYGDLLEQAVAEKVFDLAVNMGPSAAHKCVQRALRAHGFELVDDGILGSISRSMINAAFGQELVRALRSEAAGYYRSLVAAAPAKRLPFLKGWLNRAYD